MLKLICIVCLAMVTAGVAAQTTLNFCAAIDNNGACVLANTKFISSPDSAKQKICMLVRNNNGLGTVQITYHVYEVNKAGVETLIDSMQQNIEADWIYAWKPGNFKTPGKYTIKVLNSQAQQIQTGSFELF